MKKSSEILREAWLIQAQIAENYFEINKESKQGKVAAEVASGLWDSYLRALKKENEQK